MIQMEIKKTLSCAEITAELVAHFTDSHHYKPFVSFQKKEAYRPYWDLCLKAVQDRDLLSHIIFCNDLLRVPPVKVHLLYYEAAFTALVGADNKMENFVKKSIGAFWGMVFKFILGYQAQETVSISLGSCFSVRSASCYSQPQYRIQLVASPTPTEG